MPEYMHLNRKERQTNWRAPSQVPARIAHISIMYQYTKAHLEIPTMIDDPHMSYSLDLYPVIGHICHQAEAGTELGGICVREWEKRDHN